MTLRLVSPPYFYCLNIDTFGVKEDDKTTLTNEDFMVHQRFFLPISTIGWNLSTSRHRVPVPPEWLRGVALENCTHTIIIIKIHGSLVAKDYTFYKPHIFDSDHFRRYFISWEDYTDIQGHKDFSYPFRIAKLSGLYLLLDFSGDDPNSQSWFIGKIDYLFIRVKCAN